MKKTILMTIASLALASSGLARTWTSADGEKTFEGDFVSSTDDSVTVKMGHKKMTFKIDILSEADQTFIKAEAAKAAAAEENAEAAENFAKSDFGKAFKKAQKFNGKKFADHTIEEPPKFILLYYSASW